jgi:hypothetical protein
MRRRDFRAENRLCIAAPTPDLPMTEEKTGSRRLAFGVDPKHTELACEQALRRLHELRVPIFLPPLHLARRCLVPRLDRLLRSTHRRNVQPFTLANVKAALLAYSKPRFIEAQIVLEKPAQASPA